MGQLLLADDVGDDGGILLHARLVARDGRVEIGEHLEQLGKVVIEGVEDGIRLIIAEEDHLQVDVDGLGFERRAESGKGRIRRGDLQSAGAQGADEHPPRTRLGKKIAVFEDKKPPVRAEQGTGTDAHVGGERLLAHLEIVVDRSAQVAHRGRVLHDDGTAVAGSVFEHDVDAVETGEVPVVLAGTETVFHHVLDEFVEEGLDRRLGERLFDLLDEFGQDGTGRLFHDPVDGFLVLATDDVDLFADLDEPGVEPFERLVEPAVIVVADLTAGVQLVEFLR